MRRPVIVGQTVEGAPVFDGAKVFFFHATHGLPVDVQIDQIFSKGMAISWLDFARAAAKNGWSVARVAACLEEAFIDWPDVASAVLPRIGAAS